MINSGNRVSDQTRMNWLQHFDGYVLWRRVSPLSTDGLVDEPEGPPPDEAASLHALVGNPQPVVEVEEDGIGGELSEVEVPVGRALEVAPFEGRQNGFLDEVGVNVGVFVGLE